MGVNITLGNGNIGGSLAGNDGIAGIVMTGATEGTVTAGTPFTVYNQADIDALALTTGNNALAVAILAQIVAELASQGINEFELWVLLVSSSLTVANMADVSNANGAKKLVDAAGGRIKTIAVLSDDALVYPGGSGLTITNAINAHCATAISNLHALCNSYAATYWYMRGLVGITNFSGTASSLSDQTANTKNRVRAFIGDIESGTQCALGIPLARIMANPVQRKISRVLDGNIYSTEAYIATTSADAYTGTSTITSKGYITWKTYANKTGLYFNDDVTCVATTDDYHIAPRGRVIDKAAAIAYGVFINEVDNEVPVNADGTIDAGYAKALEAKITRQLNNDMASQGECSVVEAYIDPSQNVTATSTINVVIKITPVGYAQTIAITLGFQG